MPKCDRVVKDSISRKRARPECSKSVVLSSKTTMGLEKEQGPEHANA